MNKDTKQIIKGVVLLKTGKELYGTFYSKKLKLKLPKELPIQTEWDKKDVVGKAFNFRQEKNTVLCDISISEKVDTTLVSLAAAVAYNAVFSKSRKRSASNVEVVETAMVKFPTDTTLGLNVRKAEK